MRRFAHQQQPQCRIQRQRQNCRAEQSEALGIHQGPKELALLAFQNQHRQKRHCNHQQREESRPGHLANRFEDHGLVGKSLSRTLMQL